MVTKVNILSLSFRQKSLVTAAAVRKCCFGNLVEKTLPLLLSAIKLIIKKLFISMWLPVPDTDLINVM